MEIVIGSTAWRSHYS